ncbi:hypothetical protein HDU97_000949 [Phlyctochytrium planicorne]|nr:hypothetical protein HDU97_000949 [Phlyctochytrium planicorne]
MRRTLDTEKRRRKTIAGFVLVALVCLAAAGLAIYFTLIRRNRGGGGQQDYDQDDTFPGLPALSAPNTFPISTLQKPSSPSGSTIVFDPVGNPSNIGGYKLAKGNGGNSGAVAIHLALMKGSSKVAMLQRWDFRGTNATIPGTNNPAWSTEYDFTTDSFRPLRLKSNVFCGGGMLLTDGKLMVLGGAENFTELGGLLEGMRSIRFLSPSGSTGKFGDEDWTDDPSNPKITLASKRWYPSVAMLPEGRLLVVGGTIVAVAFTSPPNNTGTMEIIPPVKEYTNRNDALIPLQFLWDTLPANLYPTTTILPSGRVFMTASDRAIVLDPSTGYGALKTFLLRPSLASLRAPATNATGGVGGVCINSPVDVALATTLLSSTSPSGAASQALLNLNVAACPGSDDFNQNRTSDNPMSFAFFGNPAPSSGVATPWTVKPIDRGVYPGAGFLVHTLSRLCVSLTGDAAAGAARGVGLRRCSPEDADQLFDVGSGILKHTASGSCLGVAPGSGTGLGSLLTGSCDSSAQSQTRIEMVDTSVYFEFPRLPGGPFRSYPWTGTGLMLPLDPYNNYDPGVMVCGGSVHPEGLQGVESNASIALSTCGLIFPERPDANWTMETMPTPRVLGDLLHLPDGTLLLLNGAMRGMAGWDLGRDPNLRAHLYDTNKPVGSRWSILGTSTIPRMYHSTAMLLPDGRVMVAGSSPDSPTDPNYGHMYENEYRVEYYHPPYLTPIAGRPKPIIAELSWEQLKGRVSAAMEWGYNQTYSVRIGVADDAATSTKGIRMLTVDEMVKMNCRANVIQTGFRTHSTSFGQRLVWLVGRGGKDGVNGEFVVGSPPTAAVAPPGWYLMHVVCGGVPSEGRWVQIGGDPGGMAEYYKDY